MTPEQIQIAVAELCKTLRGADRNGKFYNGSNRYSDREVLDAFHVPRYHESIDAIRAEVMNGSEEFQVGFDCAVFNQLKLRFTDDGVLFLHQLTALDWCNCFLAAWEAVNKDKP